MIEMHHLISGLIVASEIPLSGVVEAEKTAREPDVNVRRGHVPLSLTGSPNSGANWSISGDKFLFSVPRVARMLVNSGREIVVESEGSEADAIPFLLGTAFGVLLHQRKSLVLHASAVSYEGKGIALCGPSGSGKSSLATALCRDGGSFVCDDVAAIHFDIEGTPLVQPDSRQHRLWADVIERLALSERRGEPVRANIKKYHVEPESKALPTPLSTIVFVRIAEFNGQAAALELSSLADAAALLLRNVYRAGLTRLMGGDAHLFGQAAHLLGRTRVLRLTRPREPERMEETVALLRDHLFGIH
ncbi:MAG TPA: hypothetical protein PLK99_05630 [Burkholderiales bacterium]|nr:hypothetical protein [Burkholderiales bacterium]